MVGFLIATHGGFARGILDSIELIAGRQERIDTISILHETSIDAFGKELTDKIVELDDGEGVV
ncbi:PTS sugar transporter subunit IIA, partial [Streptococcus gordonii]|nr:PTS sugar transporter subunit IIA [Streptococcus gordonii]